MKAGEFFKNVSTNIDTFQKMIDVYQGAHLPNFWAAGSTDDRVRVWNSNAHFQQNNMKTNSNNVMRGQPLG